MDEDSIASAWHYYNGGKQMEFATPIDLLKHNIEKLTQEHMKKPTNRITLQKNNLEKTTWEQMKKHTNR